MVDALPIAVDKGLRLSQLRVDVDRDTGIHATHNVNRHVYVTLGRGRDATLILHPHAARRLVVSIDNVLRELGLPLASADKTIGTLDGAASALTAIVANGGDPEDMNRARAALDAMWSAQAIEAQRAATGNTDAVEDESAVGSADAPNPSHHQGTTPND